MLSSLARRVGLLIAEKPLWADTDRVVVALSGGADSVALLRLLAELSPGAPWHLAGIVHVHHGLRGAEADEDAAFCRGLADRLELPIDVASVDVAQAMRATGQSLESAARGLRYEAFEAAAARLGGTVVVTGHTADDQAETVLLRLFRGTTMRGVSAIRFRRGPFARPLLECHRAELLEYLAGQGQSHREDQSNLDRVIPRNRLRHEVLPGIREAWPGVVDALARFAGTAEEDERLLSEVAGLERHRLVRLTAGGVELNREQLLALDPALARRVVRDAIEMAGGCPSLREVRAVLRLARAGTGTEARIDLHRLCAEHLGGTVRIGCHVERPAVTGFEYRLEVPGIVRIGETGGAIRASFLMGDRMPDLSEGWDATAALQASVVATPLVVRSRRAGDRFTPLGAPGSKSLQDLFVDRKIPRNSRDGFPVVVDASGAIVWVADVAMADRCRVRVPEAGMVILEFKKGTL